MKQIGWHSQCDGPSIFMPREALAFWEGCYPPSGGRVVEARFRWDNQELATDYDRAADASDSLCGEVFPVGNFMAYVPSGEKPITVFESRGPSEQLLIERWFYEDEDLSYKEIVGLAWEEVDQRAESDWQELGELTFPSGEVWCLHAASPEQDALESPELGVETPFSFHVAQEGEV
jgi:hypothetical protein